MAYNITRATRDGGALNQIGGTNEDCYLSIPGAGQMLFYILPEVSDSKSAHYNDEPVMGRSFPIKTYSHSENRAISMKIHFVIWKDGGINDAGSAVYNLFWLNAIQSAVYPADDPVAPYQPPPVCKIKLGRLLGMEELCVVLTQYQTSFPTDCAWDETYKVPYKFDIDTTWHVVYKASNLPGQQRIIQSSNLPGQQRTAQGAAAGGIVSFIG